jgi:uncharacterized protein (DUF488 family)
MGNIAYTIGHSNHHADVFLKLLKQHCITAVVDVRSNPYSRMNPQYNQNTLSTFLNENDITYVFLGKELGARPEDPNCYIKDKVSFERLSAAPRFKLGIDRILKGMEKYNIAIMCSEKEPLVCHRTVLVSQYLVKIGVSVNHILANGQTESHEEATQRLLDELGMQSNELFRSQDEVINDALLKREQDIAYSK